MPWAQGSLSQHPPRTTTPSIPGDLLGLTWEGSLQLLQIPQNFLAQQVNEAGHDLALEVGAPVRLNGQ